MPLPASSVLREPAGPRYDLGLFNPNNLERRGEPWPSIFAAAFLVTLRDDYAVES
jgi:hypothetical protein